jgi:hypothetical protein
LSVDLADPTSMRLALEVITQRLAASQGDEKPDEPACEVGECRPEDAEHLARDLWSRLGEPTRSLIEAFAAATEPITLREIADALGEEYSTIKARKFRFGRTEKIIERDWCVRLLPGEWDSDEGANRYRMDPEVARALREKVISAR